MDSMTGYVMPMEPPTTGWDIHCHTAFSDGTETPAVLAEQSKAVGLKGVSISDHDTTAGWPQAEAAARKVGLPLLRGAEITATDDGVSVHMLGFQYDPTDQCIVDLFARTRQARLRRTQRMVELMSKDLPISWESVLAQVKEGGNTTIGRPHIADALVAAGVYQNRSEAFADAVSASSKYYIPTPSPTAREVVAAVWHRGNLPEQRERLLGICARYHLLVTGGSDWHGKGKPNLLGENLTDEATVAEIVRRGALPLYR